jgi:hypothetical protein
MVGLRKVTRALVGSSLLLGGFAFVAEPASAAHIRCGTVVTANITLDSDIGPCPGDGLIVTASNVTINLNEFRIFATNGAGDNAGIRVAPTPPSTPGGPPSFTTGVTIIGGTVEGFDAGIAMFGGGGHTVRNMTVQNNVNDQLSRPCDLGDGIAMTNSSDNDIINNRLTNNGPYGGVSVIEDSDHNLISGNTVLGHNLRSRGGSGCGNQNQDEGIRIEGPGANDNIVENNYVEGSGLAGIGLHGFVCGDANPARNTAPNTGTIVRRNTVRNNAQDGISFLQQGPARIVCPAFGAIIERNISTGNGFDGIFVAHNSHDNTISHNVVNTNGGAGIRLNDPTFTNTFTNRGPTLFDVVTPDRAAYVEGATSDFVVLSGSGSGDVTAQLVPVGITIPPAGFDTSTSGCSPADFVGFPVGAVALIQRGFCDRAQKVNNAVAAGASAVVFFNEGSAGRTGVLTAGVSPVPIPVVGTSYAVGVELYGLTQAGPVTIHVVTNTTNVQSVAAPAPFDNTLIGNRGTGNGEVDGYDGNLEPPCDNNRWRASQFGTVNQACVRGPGGSGTATGRSGERQGNAPDLGTIGSGSAGSDIEN